MPMRVQIMTKWIVASLLLALCPTLAQCQSPKHVPNIVFILADDKCSLAAAQLSFVQEMRAIDLTLSELEITWNYVRISPLQWD